MGSSRPLLLSPVLLLAPVLEMRHAMGVAVFSGMLGVTFFGLLLTPVLYVVLQGLVERRRSEGVPTAADAREVAHV